MIKKEIKIMTLSETLDAVCLSIKLFLEKDNYLLINKIYERSITHKFAEYLQQNFCEFNVDCEYNGDIHKLHNYRKRLNISDNDLIEIAKQKIREDETYSVYPDIIIHERGINENNLLVIEVKKENGNHNDKDFDLLKLKEFTKQYNYKLGIYLEFQTGHDFKISSMKFFQDGEEKRYHDLEEFK